MTVEPLAVFSKAESRNLVINRLVRGGVDHEPVESGCHSRVGCRLKHGRGEDPRTVPETVRGEGFGGGDVLAVDVRHGGGLAHVGLEAWIEYAALLVVHPERGHRNLGVPFAVHPVGEVGAVVLMALCVSLHSVGPEDLVLKVIVVFSHHVSDRPSPVEKKPFGLFGAVQNHSCQSRHPSEKIIAPACLELSEHIPCPCLRSGLVTVREEVLDAALAEPSAGRVNVGLEIAAEIFSDRLGVEFVHLKPRGFRRGRVVGLAGKAVAEAEYSPVAFRGVPGEGPVLYEWCQIDDILQPCRLGAVGRVLHPEQAVEAVAGLVPGELDPCHSR